MSFFFRVSGNKNRGILEMEKGRGKTVEQLMRNLFEVTIPPGNRGVMAKNVPVLDRRVMWGNMQKLTRKDE